MVRLPSWYFFAEKSTENCTFEPGKLVIDQNSVEPTWIGDYDTADECEIAARNDPSLIDLSAGVHYGYGYNKDEATSCYTFSTKDWVNKRNLFFFYK